jgi:hypothetical protein
VNRRTGRPRDKDRLEPAAGLRDLFEQKPAARRPVEEDDDGGRDACQLVGDGRAEAGERIGDLCRSVGISDPTVGRWRAK